MTDSIHDRVIGVGMVGGDEGREGTGQEGWTRHGAGWKARQEGRTGKNSVWTRWRGLVVACCVVWATVGVSSGCARTSSKAGRSGNAAQSAGSGWVKLGAFEVKPPNEQGDYEFKGTFPRRYPCQKDADCTLTYLRAGHCCPDQCEAQPANKEWMAALRQLHYPTCRQWRKTHGFKACGKVKCPVPKGIPKARCIDHRCRVAYRPVVGKVKYKTVSPPRLTGPPEKPGSREKPGAREKAGSRENARPAEKPGQARPQARQPRKNRVQ